MAEQPADQPARAVAPMTSVPAVLSMLLGLLARGVRCALRLVGIGESEAARKCDLDAEALEELRMSTRFSVREIQRVRNEFLRHVADPRGITRAEFLAHPRVDARPLLLPPLQPRGQRVERAMPCRVVCPLRRQL